ncbi:DUF3558 family protein [Rhodococcus sp. ARC_M6]|uniref:DUF3558 family protein n=1 Tax=Rhodococcus sp. ARC_M6 TaxID=2928852 RepID=UPI001FB2FDF7|nr:DUF3558 family protein [Rhodococcus sp. ARC_M6]MCJ0906523.1 DUF3558 domain-containing protein [Rhodococcus sp. ARC_M6]
MAAVVALVGGCSSTVEGEAFPVDTIGMFDPCAVLSDGDLRTIGVDPGSQKVDLFDTHFPGFNVCTWQGADYYLALTSTKHTLEDVKENPEYRDFRQGEVAGREVLNFLDRDLDEGVACMVAFATTESTAMISIDVTYGDTPAEAPCVLVDRVAKIVVSLLP